MYEYKIKYLRVVDGDTFVANVDLGFGIYLIDKHVRVMHVNSPEKNTPEGLLAKAFTDQNMQKSKSLSIKVFERQDKYGRILAEVMVDGVLLSDMLIKEGHGKPYEGGTK
jgi:endonuclease YncB( thermonuclease family)